jgi:hypothetical protein
VVGEGIIELRTDASKITSDVKTAERKVESAGSTAGKKYGSGFSSSIKGLLGAAVATGAVAGAISLGKQALGEAREAQVVGAKTEQLIKSTGGAANVTAGQVSDLAGALSEKTAMDDEAIQSGANLLLTFKNVANEAGKGNDVFNQATAAALDLSSAGFGSVESASVMLGKALNDPAKGITALSRAGVTFTDQQKKQITAMQESGNMLGAQKAILKEVQGQVGGVAEASKTAGDEARVAWGNLLETVGTALLPVMDALAVVFVSVIAPAITGMVTGVGALVSVIGSVIGFIQQWAVVIGIVAAAFIVAYAQIIIFNIQVALAAVIQGTVAAATSVWTAAQWLLNAALMANPIGLIVAGILLLIAAIVIAYKKSDTFRAIVQKSWAAIKAAVMAVVNWFKGPFKSFFTSTLPNFFRSAWETVKNVAKTALKVLLVIIGGWPLLVYKILRKFGPQIASIFRQAWQAAKNAVVTGVNIVLGFIRGVPGKISNLASNFLQAGKNIGGKVIDGIRNGLSAAGGIISDVVAAVKSGINDALGLPKTFTIGAGKFKVSATIPAFQGGGMMPAPGLAMVGERGRELVALPGGAQVLNNRQTEAMLAGGNEFHIHLPTGDPQAAALAVANRLAVIS